MAIQIEVFTTHPVQYHVPIWRSMAKDPSVNVTVNYFSEMSIRGGIDPGFGVPVAWDVPMLSGYQNRFLSRTADLNRRFSFGFTEDDVPNWDAADAVLVMGYSYRFQLEVIRAARAAGKRIMIRGEFFDSKVKRGRARSVLRHYALRLLYSKIDRFCYVGVRAKEHLDRHGVPVNRQYFSPYVVDDALIAEQRLRTDRSVTRRALNIGDDEFVFLFCGKLAPVKNPLLLISALRKITTERKTVLMIVGDGILREEMQRQGQQLLGSRLLFQGFVNQSQLGPYFIASDALVLPSISETWGLVVNEAMHYGLPVIVSDNVGCAPDLVIPGQTGYVFKSGDGENLAGCMKTLVDDQEGAASMGRKALAHIERYSVTAAAKGIVAAAHGREPGE